MSVKYSVSLNGVQQGKSIEEVSTTLMPIFKRTSEQIGKMLVSGECEIKKGLDEKTAAKYKTIIESAGGLVEIKEEIEFTIDNLEQTQISEPSLSTSKIRPNNSGNGNPESSGYSSNQRIQEAPDPAARVDFNKNSKSNSKKIIFALCGVASMVVAFLFYNTLSTSHKNAQTENSANAEVRTPQSAMTTERSPCIAFDKCFQAMLTAISKNDIEALRTVAGRIDSLDKPARGNRTLARKLNDEGLKAFKDNDFPLAAAQFAKAQQEDPSDAEVAANLGFARVKINDFPGATEALMAALKIDPRRTSTWVPIAELLAKSEPKTGAAVSALLIAYEWSAARQKAIDFYTIQGNTQTDPNLQNAYQEAVRKISLYSASSTPTQTSDTTNGIPTINPKESYAKVRKTMLTAGWTPYVKAESDSCSEGDSRCQGRPEMEACSGTGRAYCKFGWRKNNSLASIVTVGESALFESAEVDINYFSRPANVQTVINTPTPQPNNSVASVELKFDQNWRLFSFSCPSLLRTLTSEQIYSSLSATLGEGRISNWCSCTYAKLSNLMPQEKIVGVIQGKLGAIDQETRIFWNQAAIGAAICAKSIDVPDQKFKAAVNGIADLIESKRKTLN